MFSSDFVIYGHIDKLLEADIGIISPICFQLFFCDSDAPDGIFLGFHAVGFADINMLCATLKEPQLTDEIIISFILIVKMVFVNLKADKV